MGGARRRGVQEVGRAAAPGGRAIAVAAESPRRDAAAARVLLARRENCESRAALPFKSWTIPVFSPRFVAGSLR
jgi:hypothetical protein